MCNHSVDINASHPEAYLSSTNDFYIFLMGLGLTMIHPMIKDVCQIL